MNGFYLNDMNGYRMDIELLTKEKELVIIVNDEEHTAQININNLEDLKALENAINDKRYKLERLLAAEKAIEGREIQP